MTEPGSRRRPRRRLTPRAEVRPRCRPPIPRRYNPPMTVTTSLWDRAADLIPSRPAAGRDRSWSALPRCPADPRRAVHVHARRRAALRDAPDAHRGATRRRAARTSSSMDVVAPPPRRRQGHDDAPGHGPRGELRDLDLGRRDRPDVRGVHQLGTQRPVRNRPRAASGRRGPPGLVAGLRAAARPCRWRRSRTPSSTRPATARTCSRPGAAGSSGTARSAGARRSSSSATIRGRSRWPATGRTSRSRSRSIARRRHPPAGRVDRRRRHPRRRGHRARAGRAAPADRLRLRLPDRDDDALLTRRVFRQPCAPDAYSPSNIVRVRVSRARKGGPASRRSRRCRACDRRSAAGRGRRRRSPIADRPRIHPRVRAPRRRAAAAVARTGPAGGTAVGEGGIDDPERPAKTLIKQDVTDLHGLGYAQELFRSMGGFSNFAISFSIISILTGAVILYDYGLAWAGTAAVMIGWPLVTVFVLAIAASMAELASAYPTAGGLYYWASQDEEQELGLVDGLAQPDRPVRDRRRHRLRRGRLPQRHDRRPDHSAARSTRPRSFRASSTASS